MSKPGSDLKKYLICIFMIIFSPPVIYGLDGAKTLHYAMPKSETEDVVEVWMKQKGYEITKEENRDVTIIKASGKDGDIQVRIVTDSPVASVVKIEAFQKGSSSEAELSEYLSDYVKKMKTGISSGKNENQDVDITGVMQNNSGNIVCIEAVFNGLTVNLTGFIADKKGLIICTAHYLNERASIRVFIITGEMLSGKLIKIDRKKDIALIDCDYAFKTEVDILKGLARMKDSQKIFAFGCAKKNSRQMINGEISGNSRKVDGQVYWQAQMNVRPGDSGGPVFTENGDFAGIIKGGLKGRLDYTYIIPLDTVLFFIRER